MKAGNVKILKFLGIFIVVFVVLLWAGVPEELGGLYSSVQPDTAAGTGGNEVTVGAFNIQVFGTSKADQEDVMTVLADVIRGYDLIAVQEIRDASGTALPALINRTNQDGSAYDALVSERLGRTISKEQYAFVYDTTTMIPEGEAFTYPEPSGTDPFHRDPFIARFSTADGGFDAVYIVVHTDPDEAEAEIAALADVVAYVRELYPDEEEIVVMGDLNADGSYFDEESDTPLRSAGYYWLIGDEVDTTVGSMNCTYDRIIITRNMTDLFGGDTGTVRFDEVFNLTSEEALAVSDHYPVYAVFSTGAAEQEDTFWSFLNTTWYEDGPFSEFVDNLTGSSDTGAADQEDSIWSFLNTTWYKYKPFTELME